MAEGSRPIARPYEGQRVNPVPEGFLASYAQIAQGMQKTGEIIGKGIGEAIAQYKQDQDEKVANQEAVGSLVGELPRIQSMLEGQIKDTPAEVVKAAQDPNNVTSAVVAYRARTAALENIGKDISGFGNKNAKGQQAIIGKYTILAKSASTWHDEQVQLAAAKRAAEKDAAGDARAATEQDLRYKEYLAKTAGQRGAAVLKDSIAEAERLSGLGIPEIQKNLYAAYARLGEITPLLAKAEKGSPIRDEYDAVVAQIKRLGDESVTVLDRAAILDTENKKDLANFEFGGDVGKAKAALPALLEQYKQITRLGIDGMPKPQKEQARWLKSDIDELKTAIAEAEKTGNPLVFKPSSVVDQNKREYRAIRATQIYEQTARATGIPVTNMEKEYVYQMAYYEGETTHDGYDIKADEKTGMLTSTRNKDWERWYQSDYANMDATQKAAFDKWQQDTNSRLAQANTQRFGVLNEQGKLVARQYIWDRYSGSGNLYIKGQLNLPQKEAAELHQYLIDENQVNMALSGIMDHLVQKDADGKPIMEGDRYKMRDISKFSTSEKREYAVKVAEFIRAKAKGLGVLSKQDWEYLDTLAPNIAKQFGENYNFSDKGVAGIADMIINSLTVNSDVILPRIQSQMKSVGERVRLKMSSYTTVEGKALEVTAGEARDLENQEYRGTRLRGWWDTVSTAKTSDYTYTNRLEQLNGVMTQTWANRNMGGAGATPFRSAYEDSLRQLTAELRSRGLSDDQIKEIIADNFPN